MTGPKTETGTKTTPRSRKSITVRGFAGQPRRTRHQGGGDRRKPSIRSQKTPPSPAANGRRRLIVRGGRPGAALAASCIWAPTGNFREATPVLYMHLRRSFFVVPRRQQVPKPRPPAGASSCQAHPVRSRPQPANAQSAAASAWMRAVSNSGTLASVAPTSRPISVQPRITPCAPRATKSTMTAR